MSTFALRNEYLVQANSNRWDCTGSSNVQNKGGKTTK